MPRMSYWAEALSLAKKNTRTFTPYKAVPSALAAIALLFFHLQPMMRTLVAVAALVGAYVLLYTLEFIWRFLIEAPVAIYKQNQSALTGLRDKLAVLEEPKKAPADLAKLQQIESILVECEDQAVARSFLNLLTQRPEYEYGEFKSAIIRNGITEEQFSSVCQKSVEGHLVLRINPSPVRPYNYLKINPEYKTLLLEVLHGR